MRKALLICEPLTRNSKEIRITANNHAYSISKSLAIIKKFCCHVVRRMPIMRAKVSVVVARMMQVFFLANSSVRKRWGNRNL